MLKFILGKSGTGKTQYIYNDIKAKCKSESGKKILLLVPEQYTYETEKRVLLEFDDYISSIVDVFSFTKLSNKILTACGYNSNRRADDITKLLVVSMAVKEVANDLSTYQNQVESVNFYSDVLSVIDELEDDLVSPEEFDEKAKNASGSVAQKLKDISLIFSAYEAILKSKGISITTDVSFAADLLESAHLAEYDSIYIDSFKSFTADEILMLEKLICLQKDVFVSLCALPEFCGQSTIFQTPCETYTTLIGLCSKNSVKYENTAVLDTAYRFNDKSVAYFGANVFKNVIEPYADENTGVTVIKANDQNKECKFIAAKIRDLVMNEGYSYKDIAVVGRNLEKYWAPLEFELSTYNIPYYYNEQESVLKTSLALFITYAFDAVSFNTEKVLSLSKSGFAGLSLNEASVLEDYCYIWDIKSALWTSDFTYRKRFEDEFSEQKSIDELNEINAIRKRLIEPLIKFSDSVKNGNCEQISRAVYKLMCDYNVEKTLSEKIANLIENHKEADARNLKQAWDRIIEVLDTMYSVVSKQNLGYKNYAKLFKQILMKTAISAPPQYIDTVTVADASMVRLSNTKAVFLIGANEGVFPMDTLSCSLLSAYERKKLSDIGLKFSYPDSKSVNEERFIAYEALSSASDKIFISYSALDSKFELQYPSLLATQAVSTFQNAEVNTEDFDAEFYCSTDKALYEYATENFYMDSANAATARYAAGLVPTLKDKIERLNSAEDKTNYKIENKQTASKLLGNEVYVSATRIEDYYSCKFYHFCKYGLNLRTLNTVELNDMLAGSILHYCLECIMRDHFDELLTLNKKQIIAISKDLINSYMDENYGGVEDKSNSYKNKLGRFAVRVSKIIEHLQKEFSQCDFVPVGFETSIGKDGEVVPEIIKSEDGKNISVTGKIDRIDLYEHDGKQYIRVIDYKSNGKTMKLSNIASGHNLQMILYLFILTSSSKSKYCGAVPAGAFYSSFAEISVDAKNSTKTSSDKKSAQNSIEMKNFALKGLILDDEIVMNAMDKKENEAYIEVSKEMVANLEEMSLLKSYCEKMIKGMVDEFSSGDIKAEPLEIENKVRCTYCEYFDICGMENKVKTKKEPKIKKAEFYQLARGEENADEQR